MIKIAHRGNYCGRNQELENNPQYLLSAIEKGYHAEVDAWYLDNNWYLGHDKPGYPVDIEFLCRSEFWIHAKNIEGYMMLYSNKDAHVFWHDRDEFIFTSKGIKWAYEGVLTHDGIIVMPERSESITQCLRSGSVRCLGVCSDNFSLFGL